MLIINDSYDEEKIKQLLSDCLHNYFSSMTDKLNNLTLSTLMKKNPYLLKIKGMKSVSELIQSSLSAYIYRHLKRLYLAMCFLNHLQLEFVVVKRLWLKD